MEILEPGSGPHLVVDAKRLAAKEALKQVAAEHPAEVGLEATADGAVEGYAATTYKGWSIVAYVKTKLGLGKPPIEGGVQVSKKLGGR